MTTWLITGCSTGLGRSLAEAVLDAGHNAVVTARDVARVQDLAAAFPDTAVAAALDVSDKEQVAEVVSQAERRFGSVDVLVNNADYGYRAAVEEGDDKEVADFVRHQLLRHGRNDQGCPSWNAVAPQRHHPQFIFDRRPSGGARLGLLLSV